MEQQNVTSQMSGQLSFWQWIEQLCSAEWDKNTAEFQSQTHRPESTAAVSDVLWRNNCLVTMTTNKADVCRETLLLMQMSSQLWKNKSRVAHDETHRHKNSTLLRDLQLNSQLSLPLDCFGCVHVCVVGWVRVTQTTLTFTHLWVIPLINRAESWHLSASLQQLSKQVKREPASWAFSLRAGWKQSICSPQCV